MKRVIWFSLGLCGLFFLILLIIASGGSQMGGARSTAILFEMEAGGQSFSGEMTSLEAEEALERMAASPEDYLAVEQTWPYTVEELYRYLGAERASYKEGTVQTTIKHILINEEYDYDEKQGYLLTDRKITYKSDTTADVFEIKEKEYDYRLPWQLMASSRYLLQEMDEKELIEIMAPDYVYAVPVLPFHSSLFSERTYDLNGEEIIFNNHIPAEHKSVYVPVTKALEPAPMVALTTTEDYLRVNGIEEHRKEEIVTTKNYRTDHKGNRKLKSIKKKKTVVREITLELGSPRPLVTRSVYGDYHHAYERELVVDKIISQGSNTVNKRDSEGNLKKRVTTQKTSYFTSDKIMASEERFEPDKSKYVTYFEERGYFEKDAVFMMNIMSLLPGASEASGLLAAGFDEPGALYMRSDMSRTIYSYIDIRPSELELDIPRFYQNDLRWAGLPFGSSTVSKGGCGPTSVSMVVAGLTGNVVTPPEMCSIAASGGFKTSEGIAWSFFSYAAKRFGLEMVELYPNASGNREMLSLLSAGHPVIVSVHKGHFTGDGHIIVLTGITQDGEIMVNDPYDPKMVKNKAWNPAIILDEANVYWVYINPDVEEEEGVS